MKGGFQTLFQSEDRKRDKFLSRLFGIFSEDFVRCWCQDQNSLYCDLGRPVIKRPRQAQGYTLDFTFQSKKDRRAYIGEMKCELEFEHYRFMTLDSPQPLVHHRKEAFQVFLDVATHPNRYAVTVRGKPQVVSGSILVWGRCTDTGRRSVVREHGLHDVLSLEAMIADLVIWQNKEFASLVDKYQSWADWLFTGLRDLKTGR